MADRRDGAPVAKRRDTKMSPRSQAAAAAAGALANGDKDGTGEGEGVSTAMEVSEGGVDAAGHNDGDGNDNSEGDGKDDGNGDGDGVGPAAKPAALPSRPSFVAAFAADKDSSLLPVSVGHCRDGVNAPPPYNFSRLASELFCTQPALAEIGLELLPNGLEPLPRDALTLKVLEKVDLAFDVVTWAYTTSARAEIVGAVAFPIVLRLTPTTTLTVASAESVMRFVSRADCTCPSTKRKSGDKNKACFTF